MRSAQPSAKACPNWGPVANEGRGRTVAMSNLYQDSDSQAARKAQAESLLDAASASNYIVSPEPGLLSTILHEATHNLGPSHEYKAFGKTDDVAFGGPLAAVFEELKAQTGALFLVEFLRSKGLITDLQAKQTYTDCIVWAFGHISQGMYAGAGKAKTRKAYSNLAAIQIGFLIDKGALTFNKASKAKNGTDTGAFTIRHDKMVAAVNDMMTLVGGIKARGDGKAATALAAKYVDGKVVPHALITERFLRFPKASFVYAVFKITKPHDVARDVARDLATAAVPRAQEAAAHWVHRPARVPSGPARTRVQAAPPSHQAYARYNQAVAFHAPRSTQCGPKSLRY